MIPAESFIISINFTTDPFLSFLFLPSLFILGLPGGTEGKNQPADAGDVGLIPTVGKIPWRRKWQPTPGFLPGKSHGQRSLAGYSPWGRKDLGMTKRVRRD